jgi:hypothetical protein
MSGDYALTGGRGFKQAEREEEPLSISSPPRLIRRQVSANAPQGTREAAIAAPVALKAIVRRSLLPLVDARSRS